MAKAMRRKSTKRRANRKKPVAKKVHSENGNFSLNIFTDISF